MGWGRSAKADLRQFDEGARAVRQAEAEWRQAMFLDRGHLAKGPLMSIRQERRIITETGGAARRLYQSSIGAGLDLFEMAIGPGDAQRRDEVGLSFGRLVGAALFEQPLDPAHRGIEILGRPGPARCRATRLRPAPRRTSRPPR